jgi:hypothetical protein
MSSGNLLSARFSLQKKRKASVFGCVKYLQNNCENPSIVNKSSKDIFLTLIFYLLL